MSELSRALRDMADWIETHEDTIPPFTSGVTLNVFPADVDVVRRLGGFKKTECDAWFVLRREFGADTKIDFNWPRAQVCTRKVVGVEQIPEKVIPAHEREIVEWECAPLLGAPVTA